MWAVAASLPHKMRIKPFLKKEPGHEKSPVDFPVVGFGVGRLEYGLCRGWVLCNTEP